MPFLADGRELGRTCSYRSRTFRRLLLPARDWGAYYRRPKSLTHRAGKRRRAPRGRRRHRADHLRHLRLGPSRSPRPYVPFPSRPFCVWQLCCRWYTLRVVPGGYVRRRTLRPFSSWPFLCRMGRLCRNMPSCWGSQGQLFMNSIWPVHLVCSVPPLRSLQYLCGLRGCAALIFIGTCLRLLVSMCRDITSSLVDVCLGPLSGLALLAAMCWIVGHCPTLS